MTSSLRGARRRASISTARRLYGTSLNIFQATVLISLMLFPIVCCLISVLGYLRIIQ